MMTVYEFVNRIEKVEMNYETEEVIFYVSEEEEKYEIKFESEEPCEPINFEEAFRTKEETYKIFINETKQYNKEQAKKYAGYIKNNMHPKEVTLKELVKASEEGKTIRPSECGNQEIEWKSQQLFYIDIDDGMSIKEFMSSKYMKLQPAFIYTSLSNTKEHNKFRVVFVNKYKVTDYKEAKQIQSRLMQYFKESDQRCKDLSRFYYGGRKSIVIDLNNKLDLSCLFYNTQEEKVEEVRESIKREEVKHIQNNTMLEALKSNDYKECRRVIQELGLEQNKIFTSEYEFEKYCKTNINLDELFGLNRIFKCILPDHEDKNPSANFFREGNQGIYLYKCFACDKTMNIFELFEALTGQDSITVREMISDLFDVKLEESEEYSRTMRMIRNNRSKIRLTQEIKEKYPNLNKILNYGRREKYLDLLSYAESNIEGDNIHGSYCVFYASFNKIQEVLGVKEHAVNKTIQIFALTGLIEKIDIKDVSDKIKKQLNNHEYERYTNCFMIKPFGYKQLAEMEKKAKGLYDNNFSVKALSSKHINVVAGEDKAQEVYKQKVVELSDYDKRRAKLATKITRQTIKRKKYITQDDVIMAIQEELQCSMTTATKLYKTFLNMILENLGLELKKVNKEIRETYKIKKKVKSNSMVLIKK